MIAQLATKLVAVWQYAAIFALFALLQSLAALQYLQAPITWIFIDAFVFAALYLLLAILLHYTIRYGKFQALPAFHQLLIYIALTALSLVVVYAVAYTLCQYIPQQFYLVFNHFLPIRLLLSLLVIALIIQHCQQNYREREPISATYEPETALQELKNSASSEATTSTPELLQRVTVKSGSKIQVVPTADIISLQADGDYVHIFTLTGKYMKESTMKYFDENLPSDLFARVHRSCIVNIHAIARIELYDKQSQQLTLKNGQQVKVSQAGYKLLRTKLNL